MFLDMQLGMSILIRSSGAYIQSALIKVLSTMVDWVTDGPVFPTPAPMVNLNIYI